MRIPLLFTALLAAVLAATPMRPAKAQEGGGEVTFSLFYDNLADDGDWYNTPEYGYVWQPDIAYKNDKWRPYSDGYWAQTDGGWTWVSYENFGWATYHYGRWTRLKDIGWAWVPGYDWGPGWVSWRTSDDYVGWAPLPPKADRGVYEGKVVEHRVERAEAVDYNDVEDESEGYTSNVDENYDIGPDNYCFVETRSFGAPVLSEVVLPYDRNVAFIGRTRNVTNIYYERDNNNVFVYNGGPDYAFISGRTERPIQRLQIERRRDPGFLALGLRAGGNPTQVHGGILQVAAPFIARRPVNFTQVKPVRIKQNLERSDVVHGWNNGGADPQVAQRVRQQFKEQAQQAPARAEQPKERLVQALPAAQRIVTKSDLPPAPQKDMSPAAVDARRAQRQQARAAQGGQGGQGGVRPGQAGPNAQPQPNAQPGQPGQPNANEKRPGAVTEQDRVARREAAQKAREAREQGRVEGQPAAGQTGQPGQPAQAAQPKDSSDQAKAARRAQRQQERAGQANPAQPATEPAGQPAAQPKDNSDEAKAARRAQRQQERANKPNPAPETQPNAGQPAPEKPQADQEREARRAQRQQERAQPPAAPQEQVPQPQQRAAQPDAEREARRAQRQQERAAQPQPQPQPQAQQADPDREARRAQRQQEQGQAAQQAQQAQQQGNQEREARRAQRQQEQGQAAQQAQQQGNQEREARRAQRQQEPPQQAQPQQAQPQGGGNAERDARRAQRQAEKGKPGDVKPDQ